LAKLGPTDRKHKGDAALFFFVEKCVLKVLAHFVLTSSALSRTITPMMYLLSLCVLILALWLASEIVARDLWGPAPEDPYRLDRWRNGEGDPDQ